MQLPTLTTDQEDKSSGSAILREVLKCLFQNMERGQSPKYSKETCLPRTRILTHSD